MGDEEMSESKQKRVTIHITSKDRSSEICACLHSLRKQTYQSFDILLLDNQYGTPLASNFKFIHDVLGRLKLEGHGVEILRDNVSFGVCKARQRLIDEDPWKENPYILRIDDDCVLEPDYIERLVQVMEDFPQCGITSGVTPPFSGPDVTRNVEEIKPIVNKIVLSETGDITYYADDCGMLYDKGDVLPAHQFRSNALLKREMFDKGLAYPKGTTNVGFREEANLSIHALLLGYKIFVDTGAVAWHAHCASGGCRYPNYQQLVQMDNERFYKFVKDNHQKIKEVL